MYFVPYYYPHPYYVHAPRCTCGQPLYQSFNNETDFGQINRSMQLEYPERKKFEDHGKEPFIINIEEAAEENNTFRTAIWTGDHLQVTLMSIGTGEDVGLEIHTDVDQFLRIEEGQGLVQMGNKKDNLYYQRSVSEDDAIMVPAGMWHNLINTGTKPLKLYSIYAPPEHPFNTTHQTKAEAMEAEGNY